ncbi:Crp/Fnr family transcriptional regulator [Pseudonocardia humida]|uniref:Crp/Fnr family transcriptional regulator n=1 Tax=Pseudonocardia humida TaxID=2800819 RepID=A0ABT1A2V9_9PSEU|nr:Crp/Fnr family transcriptional regulator [Pseudonocardia humida]MCO1657346.1 Crp/Fnr family transcriptional regulator [Pseudonocardia humida]
MCARQGGTTVNCTKLTTWIRSVGHTRAWRQGSIIFREGEPASSVLLIESGRAKAVLSAASGKQVVLAVRGPGDLLGEFAALDRQARSASIQAVTDLQGQVVTADALVGHLASDPEAALELLRLVVSRLREADLRRLDFGALDTTGRIASYLVERTRRQRAPGWLHLTQTDLGQSVGASREATVKALRKLRAAGLVETRRGGVRVIGLDGLSRLAEGWPDPL